MDRLYHSDHDRIKRELGWIRWYDQHVLTADAQLRDSVRSLEKDRAWPMKVAQHLGIDCVNLAKGGTSLQWAIEQLDQCPDLGPGDLVFIGVTQWMRGHHRIDGESYHWHVARQHRWPPQWQHAETVSAILTDHYLIWLHMIYLLRAVQISQRRGITVRLVPMFDCEQQIHEQGFSQLWQELKDGGLFHHRLPSLDSTAGNWKNRHGGHHPREHIHQQYSQLILEDLAEQGMNL